MCNLINLFPTSFKPSRLAYSRSGIRRLSRHGWSLPPLSVTCMKLAPLDLSCLPGRPLDSLTSAACCVWHLWAGGQTHCRRHRAHRPDTVVSGSTAVAASELRWWGPGRVGVVQRAKSNSSGCIYTAPALHLRSCQPQHRCVPSTYLLANSPATGVGVMSPAREREKWAHHRHPREAQDDKRAQGRRQFMRP